MNEVDLIINFWVVDSLLNFEIVKYFNNEFFEVNCYDMDLVVWEKVWRKNCLLLFVLNGG